jgi:hypothetical protein
MKRIVAPQFRQGRSTRGFRSVPKAPSIKLRHIDTLIPDERNARTHSKDQILEIVTSIRRFGWTNPVLADEVIRAGHGRRAAAQIIYGKGERIHMAPGPERGGALLPDGTVPVVDCTGWTEEEKRAYALADNRIAENAGWDVEILTGELDALAAVDFDMAPLGFDLDAIADMTATPDAGTSQTRKGGGTENDSSYEHVDQFAVIVRCATEAEQEACFNAMREAYGADRVKVVVV